MRGGLTSLSSYCSGVDEMMLIRRFIKYGLLGLCFYTTAGANATDRLAVYPEATLVGSGSLKWWGLKVYDASLYAPQGRYNPDTSYALSIQYRMDFNAADLARKSIEEISRIHGEQTDVDRDYEILKSVFADVSEGDVLVGVHVPGQKADFYHNDRFTGQILDSDLADKFFSVWLSGQTSEPELRMALIGVIE